MSEPPRILRRRKPAHPGLQAALEAAGTSHALAMALKLTPARVSQWYAIPFRHVLAIEKRFNVPRHVLLPEFYPPPDDRGAGVAEAA